MARSTQKQKNELIDITKNELGLKSRRATFSYIYGGKGPAQSFKKLGFELSHHLDGIWTLSNYKRFGIRWFVIAPCEILNAKTAITGIEESLQNAK